MNVTHRSRKTPANALLIPDRANWRGPHINATQWTARVLDQCDPETHGPKQDTKNVERISRLTYDKTRWRFELWASNRHNNKKKKTKLENGLWLNGTLRLNYLHDSSWPDIAVEKLNKDLHDEKKTSVFWFVFLHFRVFCNFTNSEKVLLRL